MIPQPSVSFEPLDFLTRQLAAWPMAADNFAAIAGIATRTVGPAGCRAQFNPARAVSTGAKTDAASIKARPCFLCKANRPVCQIAAGIFPGYEFLVNPYPIFSPHFTIPADTHTPQLIAGREGDMYKIASGLKGYCVFYNGAKCGASAPDHFHFQAVKEALPFLEAGRFPFLTFRFSAYSAEEAEKRLRHALKRVSRLPGQPKEGEPMVNILARATDGNRVEFTVIPRKAHRPDFYGTEEGQMLISPASIDLAGVIITPRRQDFDQLDEATLTRLYNQVCYPAEPEITVGIMQGEKIAYELHGPYSHSEDSDGGMTFLPENRECRFTLRDVTIGKGFHWQRDEEQTFAGALTLRPLPDGDTLAINRISIEEYLKSVISSEMSASSSATLLRAHAIVSRSWLMAMLDRPGSTGLHRIDIPAGENTPYREIISWHDREEHTLFDVCADDHCQRYQGITRITSPEVARAVEATRGMVLTYRGEICDARFSKCCGGMTEEFASCWEPVDRPYLASMRDRIGEGCRDFCDTDSESVLSQILNNFDREHPDFYRWTADIPSDTLPGLLMKKTGIDFGPVAEMAPLSRGRSGRITRLLIRGERDSAIIGKELEIRLALSPTCLKSSAFEIEKIPPGDPAMPAGGYRLHGRGWGHGVGMCQIGAAVMGSEGYTAREILSHYFPNTEITRIYE